MTTRDALSRIRLLAGLLMAGQGALVVTRILDHEAPRLVGFLLLVGGLALAAGPSLVRRGPPSAPAARRRIAPRAWIVALLGAVAVGGTLAYNALAGSGISTPELAILVYGAALLLAAPALDRRVGPTTVGTGVAYSFPLVLAPLSLYAVNAAVTSSVGATPLGWYIRHLLVRPMAALLSISGIDARMLGDTVALATPRGSLFLTVGVVCAGLYASALFLGIFALFAWEQRTPPRRLAAYLLVGLFGLHMANVFRLALLGWVGHRWGGEALQAFHQHAGWLIFLLWTLAFWWIVLRKLEGPRAYSRSTT